MYGKCDGGYLDIYCGTRKRWNESEESSIIAARLLHKTLNVWTLLLIARPLHCLSPRAASVRATCSKSVCAVREANCPSVRWNWLYVKPFRDPGRLSKKWMKPAAHVCVCVCALKQNRILHSHFKQSLSCPPCPYSLWLIHRSLWSQWSWVSAPTTAQSVWGVCVKWSSILV